MFLLSVTPEGMPGVSQTAWLPCVSQRAWLSDDVRVGRATCTDTHSVYLYFEFPTFLVLLPACLHKACSPTISAG